MSPLPSSDRLSEYAVKGAHLGLRQVSQAPEQRAARRLAVQAERIPTPGFDAPRVTILTPRSWAAHVQWEAMIGQALRLRGAQVGFVTCGGGLEICDRDNLWEAPPMPCGACTRYVEGSIRAHGFAATSLAQGWTGTDPAWPELDELSFTELAGVTYRGVPLGELVDIPVKWFLMSADVEHDPLAPLTFRRFLRAGRQVVDGVLGALDRNRPDVVLLLNGLFFFEAIAWWICRDRAIDVVTYERGFIQETLVFRRNQAACLYEMTDLWDQWAGVALTEAEAEELDAYLRGRELGLRTIDRFWGDARFDDPERRGAGRLVSLFTNLTWDSAVIGQELAFDTIGAWVAAAIEAFADRPDDELVIRIHPAEVKLPGKQTREPIEALIRDRFAELPPNVRIIPADDPTSSYPLMAASDAVLVFTSTTGLEAAVRGIPVIVAGQTHYRDRGFTVDVSDPEGFRRSLDDVLADPAAHAPDRDAAARYAYLFFFRNPVASPGVEEHVLGLARLTIDQLDDLAPGANPAVDEICDLVLGSAPARP
jgi:hypothetical protein